MLALSVGRILRPYVAQVQLDQDDMKMAVRNFTSRVVTPRLRLPTNVEPEKESIDHREQVLDECVLKRVIRMEPRT
jgi:hypothetical protein